MNHSLKEHVFPLDGMPGELRTVILNYGDIFSGSRYVTCNSINGKYINISGVSDYPEEIYREN